MWELLPSLPVRVLLLWVVGAGVFGAVHGFPDGAPASACDNMTPSHREAPQDTDPPVVVDMSDDQYQPGQVIHMQLYRPDNGTFRGFLVKMLPVVGESSDAVGALQVIGEDGQEQCNSASGNGVTHTNDNDKQMIEMTWTAPNVAAGDLKVMVTVVETYPHFWAAEELAVITDDSSSVTQPTEPTEHPPTTPGDQPDVPDPDEIDLEGCGITKGCFRSPHNCASDACEYLVTWEKQGDDTVHYEMSAVLQGHRYVAFGLSNDQTMGDDSVTQCAFNEVSNHVEISNSYNNGKGNEQLHDPQYGLELPSLRGGYNDGHITCRYSRFITPPEGEDTPVDEERVFHLDAQHYHLLMVKGDATEGIIHPHALTDTVISTQQVDFTSTDYVTLGGTVAKYPMVKAHACLMILAWMVCASIGVLLPRHFKPLWPNTKVLDLHLWFQIHRTLMVTVFVATVVAFVLIFVEVEGYSNLTDSPEKAHAPLGIVVTILGLSNPIIAIFRCGPNDSKRPIFNWVHFCVGTAAHIGGVINIFLGTYTDKAQAPSSTRYILITFMVLHVVTEAFFYIRAKCRNDAGESNIEHKANGRTNSHIIESIVLVVYAVATTSMGAALMIILASV